MTISYRVVFTPEARDQLDHLHAYISSAADTDIASGFVDGIIDHIAGLSEFPRRGTPQVDLRPGLRTLAWQRRVTIAFMVEETDMVVIGIFYGGRDFESLLEGFVRRAKGRSPRKIQQEFEHFRKRYWGCRFWQRGYFSTTSGNITDDVIENYLNRHIATDGFSRTATQPWTTRVWSFPPF